MPLERSGAIVRPLPAGRYPAQSRYPMLNDGGRVALTLPTLAIAGKFLTLDEGNQTMRTLVALGAGASDVTTRVQA